MPYILLVLGLLIGLYALYKFFITASVTDIKSFFSTALLIVIVLLLVFLSLTRRFPIAILLLLVLFPYIWKTIRQKTRSETPLSNSGPMTRKEALDILNLEENASADDIREAYKRLMQKVHPDNQGSGWMAAKLNAARDLLLGS